MKGKLQDAVSAIRRLGYSTEFVEVDEAALMIVNIPLWEARHEPVLKAIVDSGLGVLGGFASTRGYEVVVML